MKVVGNIDGEHSPIEHKFVSYVKEFSPPMKYILGLTRHEGLSYFALETVEVTIGLGRANGSEAIVSKAVCASIASKFILKPFK